MPLTTDNYGLPVSPATAGYVNPVAGLDFGSIMPEFSGPRPRPPGNGLTIPGYGQQPPAAPPQGNGLTLQPPPQQALPPQGNAGAGLPPPAFGQSMTAGTGAPPSTPAVLNGNMDYNAMLPAGTPVPNGAYRTTIPADGGPSYLQPILPNERGANGQDLMRMGNTMAEIQQANPGWSATQQMEAWRRMQSERLNTMMQNMRTGNEAANFNAGIMSNADRIASGRNALDLRRLENEEWLRSPAGRQATMEQRAYDAFNAQPPGPGRRPLADFIRDLQQAQAGGLMGNPAPHGAPPTAGPTFGIGGTAGPPPAPRPLAAAPAAPAAPEQRYNPNATGSSLPPSYGPIQSDLDRIRQGLPANEATLGAFLARLNRDNAGMIHSNPAAVRAYLQDAFGSAAYRDATSGVVDSPFGPRQAASGFWGHLLQPLRTAGQLVRGGSDWTPDLEGRSLAQALEGMVNRR